MIPQSAAKCQQMAMLEDPHGRANIIVGTQCKHNLAMDIPGLHSIIGHVINCSKDGSKDLCFGEDLYVVS
jgi:hypothetical protein